MECYFATESAFSVKAKVLYLARANGRRRMRRTLRWVHTTGSSYWFPCMMRLPTYKHHLLYIYTMSISCAGMISLPLFLYAGKTPSYRELSVLGGVLQPLLLTGRGGTHFGLREARLLVAGPGVCFGGHLLSAVGAIILSVRNSCTLYRQSLL